MLNGRLHVFRLLDLNPEARCLAIQPTDLARRGQSRATCAYTKPPEASVAEWLESNSLIEGSTVFTVARAGAIGLNLCSPISNKIEERAAHLAAR